MEVLEVLEAAGVEQPLLEGLQHLGRVTPAVTARLILAAGAAAQARGALMRLAQMAATAALARHLLLLAHL
jgi:hypothetical protein